MIKRLFDILTSVTLILLMSPFWIGVVIFMLVKRDFPILFISERMKTVDRPFTLYKFRTMRTPNSSEANTGVSGGDKSARITQLGRALRSKRLDEIPQLLNILKGDMSFVGPRPPLHQYTESHRALYQQVLQSKPGVTGLASLHYHRHEEYLLAQATSLKETDAIYKNRCIPAKAKLDLIYQRHANLCFDMAIMWQTARKVLRR